MGQVIPKEVLERLAKLAADFIQQATEDARGMTSIDTDDAESIDGAVAVNAATMAITTILQVIPLSEFGSVVALASAYGALLGSAEADKKALNAAFQAQAKAALREITVAQMPTVGNA